MYAEVVAAPASDPNLQLVLKVLPAIVLILVTSAVCGRLAILVMQPRVVGEMVAGVLLGPTLFGWLFPGVQADIFPKDVRSILYVLSTLGLTLYMFLVGAGVGHKALERGQARRSLTLAASGIIPAVVLGAGVGAALWSTLSRPDVGRLQFALFVGGALSLTAFPMLARILYERGLENSPLGRISLVAASIDDALAWVILALLTAMHLGTASSAIRTIALTIAFAAVVLGPVRLLLRPLGKAVAKTGELGMGAMYLIVLTAITGGWITDWIGIYSVFGGFLTGLAMPRDPAFRQALHARMMDVVTVLLLPLFFTFSGLNTELGGITGGSMLLALGLIMAAAFAGKYIGCSLAMRGMGFSWREAYAVGALMNARGLMILIFINIGLFHGMINKELFAVLVLVAIVSTAAALPLYKLALPGELESQQVEAGKAEAEEEYVSTAAGAGGGEEPALQTRR